MRTNQSTGFQNAPIGVFDSGLGGLTVVREIRRRLPQEHLIYFGDLARLPYGIKSKKQIIACSRENAEFLRQFGIKALVIACNSSAAAAAHDLRRRLPFPVLDVIRPAAACAIRLTRNRRIAVLGTQATIASRAYEKAIHRLDSRIRVTTRACPLFVPAVEEGLLRGKTAESIAHHYLTPIRERGTDTVILGCTHFPLLESLIQKTLGRGVRLVNSAPPTVSDLAGLLRKRGLLRPRGRGGSLLRIFVSDHPQNFLKVGARFLGEPIRHIREVKLKEKVTVHNRWIL